MVLERLFNGTENFFICSELCNLFHRHLRENGCLFVLSCSGEDSILILTL